MSADTDIQLWQYENLRKHFNRLASDVLGEDYYNMGMDVYQCDRITCEDIAHRAKRGCTFRSFLAHVVDIFKKNEVSAE